MAISLSIRSALAVGDLRTVGRADEVAEYILHYPKKLPGLITCLFDEEAGIRMRAADALEKVSRSRAGLLQKHLDVLIGLLTESPQQEMRWHLAVTLPRLQLTPSQGRPIADVLQTYLNDRSSIVKACALQGLYDLVPQFPALRATTIDLLHATLRSGTPAMRARSRKLLKTLERA